MALTLLSKDFESDYENFQKFEITYLITNDTNVNVWIPFDAYDNFICFS